MILSALLYGVLLPAALAAAVYFGSLRGRTGEPRGRAGEIALPVAVGLGFVAGFVGVSEVPGIPPVTTSGWLPLFAFATAAAGAVAAWAAPSRAAVCALTVAIAAATMWITVRPVIEHSWTANQATIWLAGLVLAVSAVTLGAEMTGKRAGDNALLAALGASAGMIAIAVALSGSALLGQTGGVLGSVCGILFFLNLREPPTSSGAAAITTMPLLAALVANGYFYASLHAAGAAILLCSPLAALGVSRLLPEQLGGWKRSVAIGTAAAVPGAIALVIALLNQPQPYNY